MIKTLNKILLSDNVKNEFYLQYKDTKFYNWLNNVLPEVEDCKKLKQDNPWHIYNCLDHILVSVEEMNKQTKNLPNEERRLLAYTMFLHDIGKPECYVRRYSKLYGRQVDSFFDHNKASVRIADEALDDFGFNEKDKEAMLALIDNHDMFMFVVLKDDGNRFHRVLTKSLIEEKVGELSRFGDGTKLMEQLLLVGRADNMAQNPQMTKDSLNKIDEMGKMLSEIKKETQNQQG